MERSAVIDGGKKVKGRKRHLLVDTQGLVLRARVHSAKVMDRDGIKTLLEAARYGFPRLSYVWLDAAYNGREKGADWVDKVLWAAVPRSCAIHASLARRK